MEFISNLSILSLNSLSTARAGWLVGFISPPQQRVEMELYDSPVSEDGRTERERERERAMGGLTRGRGFDEEGKGASNSRGAIIF